MNEQLNIGKVLLNKRIRLSLVFACSLILVYFTRQDWSKLGEIAGPIWVLVFVILLISNVGLLLFNLVYAIRERQILGVKVLVPLFSCVLALSYVYYAPRRLSTELFKSPIVYFGCYEGTMNTGRIKFRASGYFEYEHNGFFGITSFESGKWNQIGDTLFIRYNGDIPEFVGTKLLLGDDFFYRLEEDSISETRTNFYRGYCKGLN